MVSLVPSQKFWCADESAGVPVKCRLQGKSGRGLRFHVSNQHAGDASTVGLEDHTLSNTVLECDKSLMNVG